MPEASRASLSRRRRRTASAATAVVVLFALFAAGPVRADTKSDLAAAKARLAQLQKEVAAAQARQSAVQAQVDAIQAEILRTTDAIEIAQRKIEETLVGIRRRESRITLLQNRLGLRARYAYEKGPGGIFEVIFGSSSFGDLTDRLSLYNAVQQSDADLAGSIQAEKVRLLGRKHDLDELKATLETEKAHQVAQQNALQAKFAEVAAITSQLQSKAAEAQSLVGKLTKKYKEEAAALARQLAGGGVSTGLGVFKYCPVDGPNAFGDDFGAPRYGGGYHPHAGNDIVAPLGTPIRAPFSGTAENASNGLGGMSVYVRGAEGYTYNAHLSRMGTLGSVSAGTIVGYVGNSGDAAGGPYHDHFEWHPYHIPSNPHVSPYGYSVIGSAIDPYPFLIAACR